MKSLVSFHWWSKLIHCADASDLIYHFRVISRKLQQPLSLLERADVDFILLSSLRVLSGLIYAKIKSVDQNLIKYDPELFER